MITRGEFLPVFILEGNFSKATKKTVFILEGDFSKATKKQINASLQKLAILKTK